VKRSGFIALGLWVVFAALAWRCRSETRSDLKEWERQRELRANRPIDAELVFEFDAPATEEVRTSSWEEVLGPEEYERRRRDDHELRLQERIAGLHDAIRAASASEDLHDAVAACLAIDPGDGAGPRAESLECARLGFAVASRRNKDEEAFADLYAEKLEALTPDGKPHHRADIHVIVGRRLEREAPDRARRRYEQARAILDKAGPYLDMVGHQPATLAEVEVLIAALDRRGARGLTAGKRR
jgi:hypothetical protein